MTLSTVPDAATSSTDNPLISSSAQDAIVHLSTLIPELASAALAKLNVLRRNEIFNLLPPAHLEQILSATPLDVASHWKSIRRYPEGSIGRLIEPPIAVFSPEVTVGQATEELRQLTKKAFITYGFTTDEKGRLLGVIVMRELLLACPEQTLAEISLGNPFFLTPEMEITEAMKSVLNRHYPVYPVCTPEGVLVGLVRGSTLFEAQAVELSAQAGSMVGVDKEERLGTPWTTSLKFRHPWLQLNLLTAFVAAAVVGAFEGTLEKVVLLAVFLPVLAGQSGNTGSQALAVALRAMTLGEFRSGKERKALFKEGILGLCNGALVGITAGIGMFVYATMQKNNDAFKLGGIVFVAMTVSCVVSGIAGVIIPVTLKKLGADPATASSIFLTTATDVVSMGLFLGLATILL